MFPNENLEEINHVLKELDNIHYPAGTLYERISRCKALIKAETKELDVIYNLVESHCPGLRNKAVLCYEKLLAAKNVEPFSNVAALHMARDNLARKCPNRPIEENIKEMLKQLEEMPKEWTIVQLTPQYNAQDNLNEDSEVYYTNPIHISVFSCGQKQPKPFMVTIGTPKDPVNGKRVDLAQEMISIIKANKSGLMSNQNRKTFKTMKEKYDYLARMERVEDRLKALIKDIQNIWLKEWRCLLTGKYCDANLEEQIGTDIRNYFKSDVPNLQVSEKTEALLCAVVKNTVHLKLAEIKKAVQFCFPSVSDKNLVRTIAQFIRKLGNKLTLKEVDTRKHPVLLVLHDSLDCFPWEMIDVLQDELVSRLPSLHFVYCLYKEHENSMKDGQKIVTQYDKGAYIVNPDLDLDTMEIRMMTFFNYWAPDWIGISGYQPDKENFLELLTSADIFSYHGHGSGSHLLSLDKVKKTHVKAVVLLFGCGSTKIARLDPQVEMFGPYQMYLISRCPCVVGMLWEVTNMETDVLATDFMSCWIPSKASVHWKYVDKMKWKKAEENLKFVRNSESFEEEELWEPELLRALGEAKKNLPCYRTRAACVVRGLPVKIVK